jgi:hypothetical protein
LCSRISRSFDIRSYRGYSVVRNDQITSEDVDMEMNETKPQTVDLAEMAKLSVRQMWTFNVATTLLAQAIFDFHMG